MDASRQFVCIRLATYESQAEADFMIKIYKGRSGNLENTTFAILSPDGIKKLTRTGRGPFHEYRNAAQMAASMRKIAKRYQSTQKAKAEPPSLPFTETLALGLNISAADSLPLIVIAAKDPSQRESLAAMLRPLAWSNELVGQFTWAQASDEFEMKPLTGIKSMPENSNTILVVQPDQFGLSGKVLAQFDSTSDSESLKSKLIAITESFERRDKDHKSHVRVGIRMGVDWESAIPETDAQSIAARKRARGQ